MSAPPDGKFYVHGGGLTRLTVPILPFMVPQLGVLVRLEIEEHEVGEMHEFRFALTDPDGDPVGLWPTFNAELPPLPPGSPDLEEGEQRFVVLASNIGAIQVGRKGLHRFQFHVDGNLLGEIPLPVTTLTPEQLEATIHQISLRPPQAPPRPNRATRRQRPRHR